MSFKQWKLKQLVQELSDEIPEPLDGTQLVRLKDAEKLFVDRATHKMFATVYRNRNGWPDFAIEDPKTGRVEFVEVKYSGDRLSGVQVRMFRLLTKMNIPVFVWTPSNPDELIPWEEYHCGR